ncbi:Macrophage-expressed gene 1 protein [Acropora cervicornis]|uniref:Macrophage-expressed gene 1 protein n=1 Tax=Acropora cervicornis TaxID=6130 RepID=A0AAD9R189_ACRCE|nr:Macrophage-expressed gene 1 protein [Acropora cervicornis]
MALVKISLCVLLLFCAELESVPVFAGSDSALFPKAFGDPGRCPLTKGMYRFEVLPGGGWDNLRNLHMGAVSVVNYSKCKTSDDGKYLIPDNIFLYPIKKSKVETFAEFYDHWKNYTPTTSRSVNAEASLKFGGYFSVSGSYSSDFESVKKHQVEDKSVTTRVQMRHVLYTAKLQPDMGLQPAFKTRLLEIASHLQHNNTAYANFLAQILVRDFGTHYITSVNAGAVIAKVDHLTRKYFEDFKEDKSKIMASASASFFGVIGFQASYSKSTGKQDLDEYTNNTVYSTLYTFGGPPYRVNFTINQWEDQMVNDLVAVDRAGDPLHYAIIPASLSELSERSTFELADVVEKAIEQYYKHNTIKGCTKMDSPNFSFQANLDDGSCESPTNNYTFGGVYQTCEFDGSPAGNPCELLLQKNPLTADYKCREGYEAVLIHQGRTPQSCHRDCHGCWVIFRCCNTNCGYATYSTYWCLAKAEVPLNTGYMFGGIYSKVLKNPVTQDASCPLKF